MQYFALSRDRKIKIKQPPLPPRFNSRCRRYDGYLSGALRQVLLERLQRSLSKRTTPRRSNRMNDFKDAQFEHKPSGFIIVDGQEVAHTKQCCHCGIHFVSIKGSGKIRGRCMSCANAWTCGAPACDTHVP